MSKEIKCYYFYLSDNNVRINKGVYMNGQDFIISLIPDNIFAMI